MRNDINDILRWRHLTEESSEPEEMEEPEDLKSKKGYEKITREKIMDWFLENPNPDDEKLHMWAEKMGWDEHEVEEVIYRIVTDYALMIREKHEEEDEEDEI